MKPIKFVTVTPEKVAALCPVPVEAAKLKPGQRELYEGLAARFGVEPEYFLDIPPEHFPGIVQELRREKAIEFYKEHPELKPEQKRKREGKPKRGRPTTLTDEERKAADRERRKRYNKLHPEKVRASKTTSQRRRRAKLKLLKETEVVDSNERGL